MTNEERRDQVLGEWDRWVLLTLKPDIKPTENHIVGFFSHLKTHSPGILEFETTSDRYQTIHSWLMGSDRLTE